MALGGDRTIERAKRLLFDAPIQARDMAMKSAKSVTATYLRAHWLRLMKDASRTHQGLIVTHRGKQVLAITAQAAGTAPGNALKGSILLQADLLSPIAPIWGCSN